MLITCSFRNWHDYDGHKFSIARSQPIPSIFPEKKYLAPSYDLLKNWKEGKIRWDDYENKYLSQLKNLSDQHKELIQTGIIDAVRNGSNIILMCWEENPDFCHRCLFAEFCMYLELDPRLVLIN